MKTRLLIMLTALFVALGLAAPNPAQAVTGGTPDTENRYSNVALIVAYSPEGRFRCTATLISPTVLLTAAHCNDGVIGSVYVTFEWRVADQPPLPIPAAADPTIGYTDAEVLAGGGFPGTAFVHPDYSFFTDLDNWNDVGVVVLDEPVTGIAPATLAPVGTLDAIAPGDVRKTVVRAVGYGTEVRKPVSGPQRPQPMTYPLVRRYADMPGQKITPQLLVTNGNPNDQAGTGGTCFGDSGGPILLNGQIVAVTSYGINAARNCRYIAGSQRVDIPIAQSWIQQFL